MRISLLTVFFLLFFIQASALVTITAPVQSHNVIEKNIPVKELLLTQLSALSLKQVEALLGRKLNLKEKISLKVYKWTHKKNINRQQTDTGKKGQTALILGIISICALIIPVAGIVSLPLAILAIVFGNQALKINPGDKKAKTGILLGWITIGLILLAIALLIAILSSGAFWWG